MNDSSKKRFNEEIQTNVELIDEKRSKYVKWWLTWYCENRANDLWMIYERESLTKKIQTDFGLNNKSVINIFLHFEQLTTLKKILVIYELDD